MRTIYLIVWKKCEHFAFKRTNLNFVSNEGKVLVLSYVYGLLQSATVKQMIFTGFAVAVA